MSEHYIGRAAEAAAHAKANKIKKQSELDRLRRSNAELLNALELMNAHYDDLSKSNPGFMGKLCLQDYGLWNKALIAMSKALARAKEFKATQQPS